MSLLQRSYFPSIEVPRNFLEYFPNNTKHGRNSHLFAQVILPHSSAGRSLALPVVLMTNTQISECSLGKIVLPTWLFLISQGN